jgi:hypothetical protein
MLAIGEGVNFVKVIIILVLVGVLMWAINTYVPLTAGWKKLINIVAGVLIVLWLMAIFGVWEYLSSVHS